jgi:hypothetical protein
MSSDGTRKRARPVDWGGTIYFAAAGAFLSFAASMAILVVVTFAGTASDDPADEVVAPTATQPATAEPAPSATATPIDDPRPEGVPPEAVRPEFALAFGSTNAGAVDARLIYNIRCNGELFVIATTRETLYGETDCGRYWLPDDVVRPFLGEAVRIQVPVAGTGVLTVQIEAQALRIETERIWIALAQP